MRGTVAGFGGPRGEGVLIVISAVVAERRRCCGELPESMEERLGDFRWDVLVLDFSMPGRRGGES